MLMSSITFDAAMTASAVLERLARNGFWRDPADRAAKDWIAGYAKRTGVSVDEAARRLARDPSRVGAAIRRQWYANVLWYARPLEEVLYRCSNARPDEPLLYVLNLHETDSQAPISATGETPAAEGVVFAGEIPVGVNVNLPMAAARPPGRSVPGNGGSGPPPISAPAPDITFGGGTRGTRSRAARPQAAPPQEISAWPRLDAPEYVPARKPFPVVVGLAGTQQQGVAGGQVTLKVPASVKSVDVSIELIADGVDAPDGWTRTLKVDVANPTANSVMFQLVGRDPEGPEPVHLTTLEVRYVLDGTVCGTASRALVIGKSDAPVAAPPPGLGTPWAAQPPSASPITLQRDEFPADLTIEIAKTDGNAASGRFQCRLYSSHAPAGIGPFPIDLGEDAKTFAKSVVQQIRDFSGDPIVDNLLRSVGGLIAEKLPAEFFSALRSIAQAIAPRVPSVLLVSADPYVPWELAAVDPPLDANRPPYLGAQTVMGRWLRDPRDTAAAPTAVRPVAKPPAQPPSTIGVKHMAVMAGLYKAESGLRNLPEAEAEAKALAKSYQAVALAANLTDVKRMLDAKLSQEFNEIGGVEAIHFAGHGDFDPSQTDSSVLMLSEGRPLPSIMFRSANYGGDKQPQPLFFLNGCMIGIGGELLGDMGGFPGNCLKGGFGGIVGALWEVDDKVAHQIALEFWQRALPAAGGKPEPVGEILRDLRAKYSATAAEPESTYLAYVYYGHPRLTLQRVP